MKMMEIKCPNCNGQLSIAEDRTDCYCEYCGTHILIDDGVKRTITIIRDEAKLRELELQEEERVRKEEALKWKKIDWIAVFSFAVFFILFVFINKKIEANPESIPNFVKAVVTLLASFWLFFSIGRLFYRHRYDEDFKKKK